MTSMRLKEATIQARKIARRARLEETAVQREARLAEERQREAQQMLREAFRRTCASKKR